MPEPNPNPEKRTNTVDELAAQASKLRETLARLLNEVKELIDKTQAMSNQLPTKGRPPTPSD